MIRLRVVIRRVLHNQELMSWRLLISHDGLFDFDLSFWFLLFEDFLDLLDDLGFILPGRNFTRSKRAEIGVNSVPLGLEAIYLVHDT